MHRFALLLALLAIPASIAAQDPAPPGRLLDVGGHRLHLHCVGEGGPTVVLDGGAGSWSIFYRSIQTRVAASTRACVYDRAGLGWSEPGPTPRTSARMADELHALLPASGETAPWVLVGHSLGGWNVRILADRHPDLVAGVVLAEAAHEEQWDRLPPEARRLLEAAAGAYRMASETARQGALPDESVPPWPFPEDESGREAYEAAMQSPTTWETMAGEVEASIESADQVAATGHLGSIPLTVVTARHSFAAFEGTGIPIPAADAAWMEMQEELAGLSTDVRWMISESADHRIHRTDPDLLVEAILDVVARARASDGGDPSSMPPPEELRVLPPRTDPELDGLLERLESAYASMDVDRFVDLFAEDFEQIDVPRRVRVRGREAWRLQTERINAAHRVMARVHHGRARIGDWGVVEIEWSGIVRGEAIGRPGEERSYRYSGLGLLRIDDGKIRRQILYGDVTTLEEALESGPDG